MKYRPMPVPNEKDVDKAYWYFATKLLPKDYADVPLYEKRPAPQDGMSLPLPPGVDDPYRVMLAAHLPQWNEAKFWAQPYEVVGEVCSLYYKTWYTLIFEEAPSTRMLLVDRVSYEIANLPQNEVFEVSINRGGIELARWEDIQVDPAATNPAERVVFGGHYLPVPVHVRIDHDQGLTVRVRLLGPEDASGDFPRTDTDVADVTAKVILAGWSPTVMDRRDGAPRPVDPMAPLDNYGRPMASPTTLQQAKALLEWLHAR